MAADLTASSLMQRQEGALMPEEIADPERLVREVTFAVEGDGRTIEARIVPYNTPTQVVDAPHNGGTGIPYVERWVPGAFAKQEKAADKVLLNFEHERGLRGVVGHGLALREAPDALYGTFRVHPGPDGDKALHMVNEGILSGLSIEAMPVKTSRSKEGFVDRIKARLDNVALVRKGAYADALVLAVREAPPDDDPPPPEPEPDSAKVVEVEETLKRMGYRATPERHLGAPVESVAGTVHRRAVGAVLCRWDCRCWSRTVRSTARPWSGRRDRSRRCRSRSAVRSHGSSFGFTAGRAGRSEDSAQRRRASI